MTSLGPRDGYRRSLITLIGEFDAELRLDLLDGDHLDGVPRAAVEEGAVRPLARALLAADAGRGVHFNAAEGRVVGVRDPVHAVLDRAVGDTGGRACAAGATFR